jgi:hypothetical protein
MMTVSTISDIQQFLTSSVFHDIFMMSETLSYTTMSETSWSNKTLPLSRVTSHKSALPVAQNTSHSTRTGAKGSRNERQMWLSLGHSSEDIDKSGMTRLSFLQKLLVFFWLPKSTRCKPGGLHIFGSRVST